MAMPLDMNDSGTRGRYDPAPIEVTRTLSTASPPGALQQDQNGTAHNTPWKSHQGNSIQYGQRPGNKTLGERLNARLDSFRDFLSGATCECCSQIPAFLLVMLCVLLVGVLIAATVIIFMFAASGQSAALNMQGKELRIVRPFHEWPSRVDEDEDILEAISAKSMSPSNVSTCTGFGFSCTSKPGVIVSTTLRCDGKSDCIDGSDEVSCKACQSAYSCPANPSSPNSKIQICLTASHLCDGVRHCPDGWDEEFFCARECHEDEFKCGDNKCVPNSVVCNGNVDCKDGSDEKKCTNCTSDSKMCEPLNKCISPSKLCDGVPNCPDNSDEMDCTCRSCSGNGRMLCGDGHCIKESQVCDGVADCTSGMDEENCPGSCPRMLQEKDLDTVRCNDSLLYSRSEACSGHLPQCAYDCPNCDQKHAYQCNNDNKCIPKSMVCDGNTDCDGGDDEKDCRCAVLLGHFKCFNGKKCITENKRCDGVWDCSDGSDEKECDACPADSFVCPIDKVCLPMDRRCDGVADCRDQADERNCSCDECMSHLSSTYMCEGTGSCLRRTSICNPYSQCPNATKADRFFCAKLINPRS